MEFICKKCGSAKVFIETIGTRKGLYCNNCGFWIKWLNKNDLRLAQRYIENNVAKKENIIKENTIDKIRIKYFDNEIDKVQKIDNGDWIDLRSAETVKLKAGEFKIIKLGIGMILPSGYEAHIVPRSSTFKNFGIIQTNHCGIVDESYCGDNDQWGFSAYALRDTIINKNDRICQFRIIKKQPEINFETVEHLLDKDRGGFGSTGYN